jgi:hypothetical protein
MVCAWVDFFRPDSSYFFEDEKDSCYRACSKSLVAAILAVPGQVAAIQD